MNRLLAVVAVLAVGCGGPSFQIDAGGGQGGGAEQDAGEPDAGEQDAGVDAGEVDAGEVDAGEVDAGEIDAGEVDAGEADSGIVVDAGTDAGVTDSGVPDAGDTTRPTVISTAPMSGATVTPNTTVLITFDEPLNPAQVTGANVTVSHGAAGVSYLSASNTIQITLSGQSIGNTVLVTVSTAIRDVAGNTLAAPYTFSYSTGADTAPPTITSTMPVEGATYVAPGTPITIQFSEAMAASTLNATNLTVDGIGVNVSPASGNRATITPQVFSWPQNMLITARVSTAVTDAQGNPLASPFVLTFTTGDTQAPYVVSTNPPQNMTDVLPASTLAFTFNELIDPATVTSTNFVIDGMGSAVAWDAPTKTATITPGAPMATGPITARVKVGTRDMSGNALLSEYVLTFAVSPVDTTPPYVQSTSPVSGANNVAVSAVVTVTFTEPMDPATMIAANLYLDGVTATVTYSAATRTATLTPTAPFPAITVMNAHVTTGVRDLAGLAMSAPWNWTFTTKDPGPPRVTSTTPANGATGVPRSQTVTFFFNEQLTATTVNATNFFCDVPIYVYNNGTNVQVAAQGFSGWPNDTVMHCHVGTGVTDLDGTPLAAQFDLTFTIPDVVGPFVSGRLPASGATGVSITATISATYNEALNAATVTNSSFYVQGRTGTVSYNPGTFTITWTDSAPFANSTVYQVRSTNFLQDVAGNNASPANWNFTTEPDTTPPQVSSTNPVNNATNVLQTLGRMRATFNEPLAAATVNATTFTCTKTVGAVTNAEPGTVGYSSVTRTATFVPVAPFTYLARYTCTLGTGITDAVGNALAAPFVFTFVVEADTYPPRVLTSNPTQYGHFFPVGSAATVTFDEPVLAGTVTAANVRIVGVTSVVTYNAGARTATITPSAALAGDRGYVISVNGVSDTTGHTISSPITLELRTTPSTQKISATTVPAFGNLRTVEMTNGVLHLVAVGNGTNESRLQWAYFNGATWTTGDLGTSSSIPQLWTATYGTNKVGVAWRDDVGVTRQFRSFDGSTWTAATTIPDRFGTVMAGGNNLGLLMSPAAGPGVEVQFFDGATWGPVTSLSANGNPNSLAYNGTEWLAVWRYATGTIGDWHVVARAFDGVTWGTATDLMTFPVPPMPVDPKWAIAANPSGFAVAFSDVGAGYCAVRYNGVWQTRVTSGFGGQVKFGWFQLVANGSGYAWAFTAGASVFDLYYRIWDASTQTWSQQPNIGVAYLGRGRSIALTASGTDYFISQELLISGVAGHRYAAGAWVSTTLATSGLSPVGPIGSAAGRTAMTWNIGTEWWSSIWSGGSWGAAARLDAAGTLSSPSLARTGTSLHAFFTEAEDLRVRTNAAGSTFAAPVSVPNVGLNGPATTPTIAFADDGRALAVWEQYEAGQRRIFARYWDGAAWVGPPFRVTTLYSFKPRVATNGSRWVITWLEFVNGTGNQNAWRTSWTLAGGVTAAVKENGPLNAFDTAIASTDGTFLFAYMEDRYVHTKFSADGLTFGPREDPVTYSVDFSTPLGLVAVPGTYALSWGYFSSYTQTAERGITAGSPWSSVTQRNGWCSIARMETTYGGACSSPGLAGPVTGYVNTQLPTTLATGYLGYALAVGGQGDRLRATWATTVRDDDPYFEWGAALTSPAAMTAVADDSIHFFGIATGSGGNGLNVYVESASTGFALQQSLDATAAPLTTPSLTRSRGDLGALWGRPDVTGTRPEIWGTVF